MIMNSGSTLADLELILGCGPSQASGVRPSSGSATSDAEDASLHSTLDQLWEHAAPGDGRSPLGYQSESL